MSEKATGSNQPASSSSKKKEEIDEEGGGLFGGPILLNACGVYEARDAQGRWFNCMPKTKIDNENYVVSVQANSFGITLSDCKVNIKDMRLRIVYGVPNLYEGKDLGGQWWRVKPVAPARKGMIIIAVHDHGSGDEYKNMKTSRENIRLRHFIEEEHLYHAKDLMGNHWPVVLHKHVAHDNFVCSIQFDGESMDGRKVNYNDVILSGQADLLSIAKKRHSEGMDGELLSSENETQGHSSRAKSLSSRKSDKVRKERFEHYDQVARDSYDWRHQPSASAAQPATISGLEPEKSVPKDKDILPATTGDGSQFIADPAARDSNDWAERTPYNDVATAQTIAKDLKTPPATHPAPLPPTESEVEMQSDGDVSEQERAAAKLQATIKANQAKKELDAKKQAAVQLQSSFRGKQARDKFTNMKGDPFPDDLQDEHGAEPAPLETQHDLDLAKSESFFGETWESSKDKHSELPSDRSGSKMIYAGTAYLPGLDQKTDTVEVVSEPFTISESSARDSMEDETARERSSKLVSAGKRDALGRRSSNPMVSSGLIDGPLERERSAQPDVSESRVQDYPTNTLQRVRSGSVPINNMIDRSMHRERSFSQPDAVEKRVQDYPVGALWESSGNLKDHGPPGTTARDRTREDFEKRVAQGKIAPSTMEALQKRRFEREQKRLAEGFQGRSPSPGSRAAIPSARADNQSARYQFKDSSSAPTGTLLRDAIPDALRAGGYDRASELILSDTKNLKAIAGDDDDVNAVVKAKEAERQIEKFEKEKANTLRRIEDKERELEIARKQGLAAQRSLLERRLREAEAVDLENQRLKVELQKAHDLATQAVQERDHIRDRASEAIVTMKNDLDDAHMDAEECAKIADNKHKEVEKHQENLSNLQEQHSRNIARHHADRQNLAERNAALEDQLEKNRQQLMALEDQHDADVKSMVAAKQALQKEMEVHKQHINELMQQMKDLEDAYKQRLADLQRQLDDNHSHHQGIHNDLKDQLDNEKQRSFKLENEHGALKDKHRALQDEHDAKHAALTDHLNQLDGLDDLLDNERKNTKKLKDAHKGAIEEFEASNQALERALAAREGEMRRLQNEYDGDQRLIEQLQRDLEHEKERADLEKEAADKLGNDIDRQKREYEVHTKQLLEELRRERSINDDLREAADLAEIQRDEAQRDIENEKHKFQRQIEELDALNHKLEDDRDIALHEEKNVREQYNRKLEMIKAQHEDELDRLRRQLSAADAASRAYKSDLDHQRTVLDDLKNQIDRHQDDKEKHILNLQLDHDAKLRDLRNDHAAVTREKNRLKDEVDHHQNQAKQHADRAGDLAKQLDKHKFDAQEREAAIRAQAMPEIRAKLHSEFAGREDQHKSNVERLQMEIERLRALHHDVEQERDEAVRGQKQYQCMLDEEKSAHKSEVRSLLRHLDNDKEILRDQDSVIRQLKTENDRLRLFQGGEPRSGLTGLRAESGALSGRDMRNFGETSASARVTGGRYSSRLTDFNANSARLHEDAEVALRSASMRTRQQNPDEFITLARRTLQQGVGVDPDSRQASREASLTRNDNFTKRNRERDATRRAPSREQSSRNRSSPRKRENLNFYGSDDSARQIASAYIEPSIQPSSQVSSEKYVLGTDGRPLPVLDATGIPLRDNSGNVIYRREHAERKTIPFRSSSSRPTSAHLRPAASSARSVAYNERIENKAVRQDDGDLRVKRAIVRTTEETQTMKDGTRVKVIATQHSPFSSVRDSSGDSLYEDDKAVVQKSRSRNPTKVERVEAERPQGYLSSSSPESP